MPPAMSPPKHSESRRFPDADRHGVAACFVGRHHYPDSRCATPRRAYKIPSVVGDRLLDSFRSVPNQPNTNGCTNMDDKCLYSVKCLVWDCAQQ
eukprot:2071252-Amphidinium_carterae.1